jgi:hypothetical protein
METKSLVAAMRSIRNDLGDSRIGRNGGTRRDYRYGIAENLRDKRRHNAAGLRRILRARYERRMATA